MSDNKIASAPHNTDKILHSFLKNITPQRNKLKQQHNKLNKQRNKFHFLVFTFHFLAISQIKRPAVCSELQCRKRLQDISVHDDFINRRRRQNTGLRMLDIGRPAGSRPVLRTDWNPEQHHIRRVALSHALPRTT